MLMGGGSELNMPPSSEKLTQIINGKRNTLAQQTLVHTRRTVDLMMHRQKSTSVDVTSSP